MIPDIRAAGEKCLALCAKCATCDANYPRSRPLTSADKANLKKLLICPELKDVRPFIEHLLKRGVKLEQEGVE